MTTMSFVLFSQKFVCLQSIMNATSFLHRGDRLPASTRVASCSLNWREDSMMWFHVIVVTCGELFINEVQALFHDCHRNSMGDHGRDESRALSLAWYDAILQFLACPLKHGKQCWSHGGNLRTHVWKEPCRAVETGNLAPHRLADLRHGSLVK
jgi:hypothetical protein